MLMPGEPAPWFRGPVLQNNPNFEFDTMAGRYVVLLFAGSMGDPAAAAARMVLAAHRALLDDEKAMFFGITRDPADVAEGRITSMPPGIRWFLDFNGTISRGYAALDVNGAGRDFWLLLDPMLRIVACETLDRAGQIFARLAQLIGPPRDEGLAPVLMVPGIFEPDFCRQIIDLYESHGGEPSGFMQQIGGKTVGTLNGQIKRRSDHWIEDAAFKEQIAQKLGRRLIPMIGRFLGFAVTRIERYVIACYGGEDGGYFRAHRDNTTSGTVHRRFACTINLNAEDYEGGDLVFPEFGTRRYRAPTGGACVFSCSMLHEATSVTRGKRYAFLPFFYDEAGAQQREAIARTGNVSADLAAYRA